MSVMIEVFDIEKGRVIWEEDWHEDFHSAYSAVQQLAEQYYNPGFFKFYIDKKEIKLHRAT